MLKDTVDPAVDGKKGSWLCGGCVVWKLGSSMSYVVTI